MNLLDIVIIITMVFLVIKGLFRGFIREIASLAGIILGILLASRFQPLMTAFLKTVLPSIPFLSLISFAVIFAIVLLLCNLLGWGTQLILKKAFLGWADKALGTGLAVAKGVIIIYLVIILLTFFLPARTPLIAQSRLAPLIITSYQTMVRLVSPERYQRLKERFMDKMVDGGGRQKEKQKDEFRKNGT